MKIENGCSPAQHYLIHRARTAQWERERHRRIAFSKPRSTAQATVEAIIVTLIWVGIFAALIWG